MNVGGSTCLAFILTVCSSQLACAAADYPPTEDDGRKLVATIFGRQVFAGEPVAKRLFSEISRSAHREYAAAKKLTPTREQLTKMFSNTIARHPELLKNEEAERNTAIRLFWLRGASLDWIVAKALYEEYGGSIATSSFGACTSGLTLIKPRVQQCNPGLGYPPSFEIPSG